MITFLRTQVLAILVSMLVLFSGGFAQSNSAEPASPTLGYRDFAPEQQVEKQFLAVPDAKLAEEHLRTLTAAPHIAASPEDKQTAEYEAQKFRDAGLETDIIEYRVWIDRPAEISV